jgi:hypothetical protein
VGCLLELFSKTRDRNITNPAISTAAKKPVRPTTTNPMTGFPPDPISSAPVNTMLTPVPTEVGLVHLDDELEQG